MPKEKKGCITRPEQYEQVHRRGRFWGGRLLSMKALPNGLDHHRYGLVVGKKVGGAVERNRVKRRLRQIMRQTAVKPGWDIVFIARSGAAEITYARLKELAHRLMNRAGLVTENYERNCLGTG
jgi:ribonuclease P protein component